MSLPLWERGLKFTALNQLSVFQRSLPLWERGLKSYTNAPATSAVPASLPLWERGLKSLFIQVVQKLLKSLPLWERGLKLRVVLLSVLRIQVGDMLDECVERFPF